MIIIVKKIVSVIITNKRSAEINLHCSGVNKMRVFLGLLMLVFVLGCSVKI